MERGANTFPFHNLLPYSESNEGLFLFFLPSLNWIKEKSVATLAIRNICDQTQNNVSCTKNLFIHKNTCMCRHICYMHQHMWINNKVCRLCNYVSTHSLF